MTNGEGTNEHLDFLEKQLKESENKVAQLSGYASAGIYGGQQQDSNLIMWQLELDNILERIEHLLRGDIVKVDKDENVTYDVPKDKSLIILNNYGVQLIMNVTSFYLNRNTILSTYDDGRIKDILYDLGNELADVVYINYEKMGMDTIEKKSRYEILILNILHTIESSYNRALSGGERDSLRSARVVTESLVPGGRQPYNMPRKRHRGGFLNPKNWQF